MPGDELIARIEALEARVGELEDELELYRSVASYSPAVDSGDAGAAAALWTQEGEYDIAGWGTLRGNQQLREIVDNPGHQAMLDRGCAHVLTPPRIQLQGDRAEGWGVSLVVLAGEDGFEVARVSANHYRWARTPEGWRLTTRTNRLLDGSPEARSALSPEAGI